MLKFNIIDPSWFEAYAAACGNNKDKLLKYFEKHVTSKCGNVNRSINQSINQPQRRQVYVGPIYCVNVLQPSATRG